MTLPDHWLLYVAIGVISGILSGTLGVGSGIVMVPILVMFAMPQKAAQGTALAVMVPMALVASIRYKLNPEMSFQSNIVVLIACGALVGVFFGTSIAASLPGATLRKLFSLLLLFAAVRMYTMK